MKKLISILVAFAMMATLCVCMAFAKQSSTNAADPYEPATITVSKVFKIPAGVKSPAETFKFNIAKVSVDGNTDTTSLAAMPDLTLANIQIAADTVASADNDIVKNGVITLPALGTEQGQFPHAGTYVYYLTETDEHATNPDVNYNTGNKSYDLYIYVANDGTVTPIVVNHGVTPTPDNPATEDVNENNKLNPDPKDPSDPGADQDPEDDQLSDVNFTNAYDVIADDTDIPDDTDPNTLDTASAKVTKTVPATGNADLTKLFKFTFAIDTSNYQGDDTLNITYAKVAADGTQTPIADPVTNGFSLANGETFAIFGAPVGTKYTVTENLSDDDAAALQYTPSAILTTKGVAGDEVTQAQGTDIAFTNALVENGENIAAYTNEKTADTTPTGILISNLPYIALALVAIGGLVAYVVVRRRQDDEA